MKLRFDPKFYRRKASINSVRPLFCGMEIAEQAYGTAIRNSLQSSLDDFKSNRSRANAHIRSLGVEDTQTLRKGLKLLGKLVQRTSTAR